MLIQSNSSEENEMMSTNFIQDNKKEILQFTHLCYYILAIIVSILISLP